jgi:hypothetical protein
MRASYRRIYPLASPGAPARAPSHTLGRTTAAAVPDPANQVKPPERILRGSVATGSPVPENPASTCGIASATCRTRAGRRRWLKRVGTSSWTFGPGRPGGWPSPRLVPPHRSVPLRPRSRGRRPGGPRHEHGEHSARRLGPVPSHDAGVPPVRQRHRPSRPLEPRPRDRLSLLPRQRRGLGLNWHFVDVVWIFLFPLLYLIQR